MQVNIYQQVSCISLSNLVWHHQWKPPQVFCVLFWFREWNRCTFRWRGEIGYSDIPIPKLYPRRNGSFLGGIHPLTTSIWPSPFGNLHEMTGMIPISATIITAITLLLSNYRGSKTESSSNSVTINILHIESSGPLLGEHSWNTFRISLDAEWLIWCFPNSCWRWDLGFRYHRSSMPNIAYKVISVYCLKIKDPQKRIDL